MSKGILQFVLTIQALHVFLRFGEPLTETEPDEYLLVKKKSKSKDKCFIQSQRKYFIQSKYIGDTNSLKVMV